MLDEYKEFEEYTYDIGNIQDPPERIRWGMLQVRYSQKTGRGKYSFAGMNRPLSVIARFFLFRDGASVKEAAARAQEVKNILCCWCGSAAGIPGNLPAEYAHLDRWFPRYLTTIIPDSIDDAGREKVLQNQCQKAGERKEKGYLRKVFPNRISDYDYFAIGYDRVIANALRTGPLHRYALGVMEGAFDAVEKRGGVSGSRRRSSKKGEMLARVTGIAMMSAPACSGETPGTVPGEFMINPTDLGNWYTSKIKIEKRHYACFIYNGEDFLEECDQIGKTGTIYCLNRKWVECFRPMLVRTDQEGDVPETFIREHPGYVYYVDNGGGRRMTVILPE